MTIKLEVELPADIFDVQVNVPLIHQVVVAQQAAARQGTAKTKTRGEVRGGGSKPYRQKGTGRARQGSIRAPQFSGGGVVHGPVPRDFSQRTPKKMKAAALRGALSDRARHGRVHVVSALVDGDTPSTRAAAGALRELTAARHVLLVADRGDELTWLSVRNLPAVHVIAPDQLNTYDVLVSDEVVFTEQGYQQFLSGPATGRSAKGAARSGELPDLATHETAGGVPSVAPAGGTVEETVTAAEPEKPAADAQPSAADTAEAPYGPGSRAATEDGGQPEGFPIKGNAGSKKYHQPGGRWYEQTAAEVWFASAADAEKAGFTEAGKSSPSAADEESEK